MPTPDPRDFTNLYNTPLGVDEEEAFQSWARANGKDPMNETYDYDLRGWYVQTDGASLSGGHLSDQFKKPNHPTFSDESMYHGVDGYYGGHWNDNNTFTQGETSLWSTPELNDYFSKYDAEYTVIPNPMTNPM